MLLNLWGNSAFHSKQQTMSKAELPLEYRFSSNTALYRVRKFIVLAGT